MAFSLKNIFGSGEKTDEYVEIDLDSAEQKETKVIVKPFVLRQYEDVTDILNSLREGYTIAVIDIKTLKSKDIVELKRAVSKIKKTVDAIEGSIAGFGENVVIVTPKFAQIHKAPEPVAKKVDFIGEKGYKDFT
jgi:SepF-like predicted cell division protein (DUF552 family)